MLESLISQKYLSHGVKSSLLAYVKIPVKDSLSIALESLSQLIFSTTLYWKDIRIRISTFVAVKTPSLLNRLNLYS